MLQSVNGVSLLCTLPPTPQPLSQPVHSEWFGFLLGLGLVLFGFFKALFPHCNNISGASLVLAHMGPVVTPWPSKYVP